jgi:ATP-dependent RNA helicase DHX37/DHR1
MHALTDIKGKQIAALAKGTPLLSYSKPIKEVMPKMGARGDVRECWVIPSLKPEGSGGLGWALPAVKVTQKNIPGRGWIVE